MAATTIPPRIGIQGGRDWLLITALLCKKRAPPRFSQPGPAREARRHDIAVIGVDDNAWGQWMRPALSTLVLEPANVTSQLVAVLDAIRRGSPYPEALPLAPAVRVVHRQTT
jgi:hypothetical protein